MTPNLLNTIYLAGVFLALFGSAELLYHKFKVSAEITRKYVHIATGLLTLLFPILIENHWLVLALCGSFLLILQLSLRFNKLPSINGVTRVSKGSVLYPVVVYGCYLVYSHYHTLTLFYIPILVLAISDPVAALVGKTWPKMPFTTFGHQKTVSGSLGFLLTAFAISFLVFFFDNSYSVQYPLLLAGSIAIGSTLAEAISHKGYDNLTIPGSVLLVLLLING